MARFTMLAVVVLLAVTACDEKTPAYLRGLDGQFVVNGGAYAGPRDTMYTLDIERPE